MAETSGYLKTLVLPSFSFVFLSFAPYTSGIAGAMVFLDRESTECVQCHESSVDPSVPQKVCHGGLCDHPVGVDYAELASRNPGLVKPSALNPAVRLPDGMIACTSCHVPYNNQYDHKTLSDNRKDPTIPDPMLSVNNNGSGLCAACHLK